MKVWICESCGCEVKEKRPEKCPLCSAPSDKFFEGEAKNPDKEDQNAIEKYEQVINKLDEYTEDCEPEDLRYSFEE